MCIIHGYDIHSATYGGTAVVVGRTAVVVGVTAGIAHALIT